MRAQLQKATLYGILDLGYTSPADLITTTSQLLSGGVDVLQLRAKGHSGEQIEAWSREVLPVCREHGVPFIVNDHAEIAIKVGADGVHVGQDDMSMDEVRRIVGPDLLVGRSTHSLEQAAAAAADERTDCIGFGPLFATPTKPGRQPIGVEDIAQVHQNHPDLPIFCIGGIKKENVAVLVARGAKRVVIVSGLLLAPDIEAYAGEVRAILKKGDLDPDFSFSEAESTIVSAD